MLEFISNDGEHFDLYPCRLDRTTVLNTIINNPHFNHHKVGNRFQLASTAVELKPLFDYLNKGTTENLSADILDVYGVVIPPSWHKLDLEPWRIRLEEDWCRRYTTKNPSVKKHKLCDVIDTFLPPLVENRFDTLFSPERNYMLSPKTKAMMRERNYQTILPYIDLSLFKGQLVLAGGSVLSNVMDTKVRDYDLFFVGCNEERAIEIMNLILLKMGRQIRKYILTENSLTLYYYPGRYPIANGKREKIKATLIKFQFIFRLYKNIDEILLGFDIDCSAILYDGQEVWLAERCLYALKNRVNTVDNTRMSTTYEHRLIKYLKRGFDIRIPGFDIHNVLLDKFPFLPNLCRLQINHEEGYTKVISLKKQGSKRSVTVEYEKLQGLDLLLVLYYQSSKIIPTTNSDYEQNEGIRRGKWKYDTIEIGNINRDYASIVYNNRWVKFEEVFDIETIFKVAKKVGVEQKWKSQDPGEQISSSFHKIVMDDIQQWMKGELYQLIV